MRMPGAGRPSASPGRDQLAHRPAGTGVQPVPDQHDRAAGLLVSWPPVTFTTGVWPRCPQVRPFGGLSPWPLRRVQATLSGYLIALA